MAFQTAITIKKALENIQGRRYAMPAIQREFVWEPEQIEQLFDSLMQGFPIGAFLFWEVEPETVKQYRWYGFMRHYIRDRSLNQEFEPRDDVSGFTAVLDGQQRLTALNVGLRGSYAEKLPRKRRDNPDAYPRQYLYFNFSHELEKDEFGAKYEFRFMTPEQFKEDGGKTKWFRVSDVLGMDDSAVYDYVLDAGIMDNVADQSDREERRGMQRRLVKLWHAVHSHAPISHFLESDQDLDKVLHIFVRTNSGGTELSNSDLLLSIVTAQWRNLDAREEVAVRTDQLNSIGEGFQFPRDFVLKSALVLADIPDIGFSASNFNHGNVRRLEQNWDRSMDALNTAVKLAAEFGLSGEKRLESRNALIPIAYHLQNAGIDDSVVDAPVQREARETIRTFLYRMLIARVWGGSSDTILTFLRNEIRASDSTTFPAGRLRSALRLRNRPLDFDEEQLEAIVDTDYGQRAFVLLAMLYPDVKVGEYHTHMDHFFPKSRLTRRRLEHLGLQSPMINNIRDRMNQLPNLVLLRGSDNTSKGNAMPGEWMGSRFETERARRTFENDHDLGEVPDDVSGFVDWYEARRKRMLIKLQELIGRD